MVGFRGTNPWGPILRATFSSLGGFLGPSDQNELYHTTLLSMDISKILDLSDRNVLVKGPFKENFDSRVARSVSQSVSLDS